MSFLNLFNTSFCEIPELKKKKKTVAQDNKTHFVLLFSFVLCVPKQQVK